jgi:hypothetical protein
MARSPRRRIPFASVIGELTVLQDPVGLAKTSADLTPATGARTTRFCRTRTAPLVLRGSIAHSPKTKPEAALQCLARASALASTATRTPRIVTTRTPLFDEAGWRVKETDLRKMRSRIFSPRNLDDPNRVELAGEIRVLAQRVLVYFRTLDRGSKCSLTCPVGRSVLASTQAKPIAGG